MNTLPPEVLFAKHRLLPEIGAEGQRALCQSTYVLPAALGVIAHEAAHTYLVRSGVDVASQEAPARAHEGASRACLAELEGALVALDHVCRVTGIGASLAIADVLASKAETR